MTRLTGRRVCNSCGALYHIVSKPTKVDGICDVCGGVVVQRKDDHKEIIGTRLEAYDTNTKPLKNYFRDKGLYLDIDATGNTEDVFESLKKVIDS